MGAQFVLKRTAMFVAVSTIFLLSACGGGGGGGSNPYIKPDAPVDSSGYSSGQMASFGFTPGTRTQVPFSTPSLISTFNPYAGNSNTYNVSQQYVVSNLTGDGGQDMIIAGRQTQPATAATWTNSAIQIFDWQGGKFVNDTAKWFPGGINSILGTDPTIQFADFFKTGRTDMFVAPSTDMNYFGPSGTSQAWFYKNTGNQFNLTTINLGAPVWGHGATIADLTGSGYQDIVITDYGPNTTLLMNNHVNGFTPYQAVYDASGHKDLYYGGSSAAVANFLGNGATQLAVSDASCQIVGYNGCGSSTTKLYSWAIDPVSNQLTFNYIKDLPTPILDQAQYLTLGSGGGHNYLIINNDFSGTGGQDLIIFSEPHNTNTSLKSAIQFLKNDGHGNFTDVTSTMLVGYDMTMSGTYHPQFIDLGNGFQSMIVSSGSTSGKNTNTQVLIKQSASGPYIAAFQNIITDFASESNLIANIQNSQNQVAMVKDPSNNVYLVTTVQYTANGQKMMGTYLSTLGASVNAITAQSAFNAVKAQWPWMSDAQANAILAKTASNYMTDAGMGLVLNPDAIKGPFGGLSVATRTGMMNLNGGISGVNLGNLSQVQALDSLGRNFTVNFGKNNYLGPNSFGVNSEHIDQYSMTSHAEYLINGNSNTMYSPLGSMRVGFETRNQYNTIGAPTPPPEFGNSSNGQGMYLGMTQPKQYTFGIPEVYRSGNFYTGTQYTSLNTNPWFNFTGAFGSVMNSGTLEQVATYTKNGFSVQGALMYTTTNFRPGMITQVTPITAGWAETGYRYTDYSSFGDLGVYLGVKPVVLSGGLTANMPTGVDNSGNMLYTTQKMGIVSSTVPYARALYTGVINRNSTYRLSGMAAPGGLLRTMAEYRYSFD